MVNKKKSSPDSLDTSKTPSEAPNYSKTQQAFIAVACLVIFPLIYLIGKLITNWLAH